MSPKGSGMRKCASGNGSRTTPSSKNQHLVRHSEFALVFNLLYDPYVGTHRECREKILGFTGVVSLWYTLCMRIVFEAGNVF